MADKDDSGDKTEHPTRKRLDDARRKGDVAKSKDLTSTAGLLVWLVLILIAGALFADRLTGLFEQSLSAGVFGAQPFAESLVTLGWAALVTVLLLTAAVLVPAALIGSIAEFLQSGAILSLEKVKPTLSHLNPVEGLKRMISVDNLVELLKTLVKAGLLLAVTIAVIAASLPDLLGSMGPQGLPLGAGDGRMQVGASLALTQDVTVRMLAWTLGAFLFVAVLDMAWQRHSYIKKLRMSLRDIRDEMKQSEGDPHVKSSRKGLHQEWANQNAVQSARSANVLVVNPTHIAVALDYDPDTAPVPVIAAMAEGPLAQAMREAAEGADVPIVRNVEVARALFDRGVVEDHVPRDLFEAVAEIILWARQVREGGLADRRTQG
jgi:type III secretion protein U